MSGDILVILTKRRLKCETMKVSLHFIWGTRYLGNSLVRVR